MEGRGRRTKAIAAFTLILGCALISLPVSAATTLTVGKASATSDALVPVNIGYELGLSGRTGSTSRSWISPAAAKWTRR